jgi:hypothetical protein
MIDTQEEFILERRMRRKVEKSWPRVHNEMLCQ